MNVAFTLPDGYRLWALQQGTDNRWSAVLYMRGVSRNRGNDDVLTPTGRGDTPQAAINAAVGRPAEEVQIDQEQAARLCAALAAAAGARR